MRRTVYVVCKIHQKHTELTLQSAGGFISSELKLSFVVIILMLLRLVYAVRFLLFLYYKNPMKRAVVYINSSVIFT